MYPSFESIWMWVFYSHFIEDLTQYLKNWFFYKESLKLTFYRKLKPHWNQGCGKSKQFLLHYRVVFIFFCTTSFQTFRLIIYIWVVQYGRHHDSVDRYGISVSQKVTKGHRHVPFVVTTILSFPRAWLYTFSLNKSKTTGTNSGTRTAYHFGAPVFTCAPVDFLAR